MQNLSNSEVQDKLMLKEDINWNNYNTWKKRGACIVKENYAVSRPNYNSEKSITTTRTRWVVDKEIPIFTKNREYINQHVYIAKDKE